MLLTTLSLRFEKVNSTRRGCRLQNEQGIVWFMWSLRCHQISLWNLSFFHANITFLARRVPFYLIKQLYNESPFKWLLYKTLVILPTSSAVAGFRILFPSKSYPICGYSLYHSTGMFPIVFRASCYKSSWHEKFK